MLKPWLAPELVSINRLPMHGVPHADGPSFGAAPPCTWGYDYASPCASRQLYCG